MSVLSDIDFLAGPLILVFGYKSTPSLPMQDYSEIS